MVNNMGEHERINVALKEWEEKVLPKIKERSINFELFTKLDHIIDIVGVRRSGKTYLMYLVIKKLFEKGLDKNSVIYINFENKVLYPLSVKLLDELLNYFFEKKPKKMFLFLDEIHNVKGWERWARNVYDEYKGKIKLVVSGSTSKIMAEKISSLLTGRHISVKLLPLSFKEFLDFKGFVFSNSDLKYSKKKNVEIRKLFEEYMKFGGFPEVVLTNEDMRMDILRAYYEDILYKDIVEKFKVREIVILENFIKFLFSNISSYFSFKRAQEYLNSVGIKTSTRTLLKYVSILEETFLFSFLPIFTKKVKNVLKYPRKIYCVDVGLRNVTNPFSEDFGKICENIVFLELKRTSFKNPSISINYWKDEHGNEVDFVVRERDKVIELIQVSWKVEESKKRKVQSLVKSMDEFGLREAKVITFDFESEERVGNKKIYFIPLYKWLLTQNKLQ
jgi:predicted AAA+ superfamily ATPase